jgi:hypothetical protein
VTLYTRGWSEEARIKKDPAVEVFFLYSWSGVAVRKSHCPPYIRYPEAGGRGVERGRIGLLDLSQVP